MFDYVHDDKNIVLKVPDYMYDGKKDTLRVSDYVDNNKEPDQSNSWSKTENNVYLYFSH